MNFMSLLGNRNFDPLSVVYDLNGKLEIIQGGYL